MGFCNLCMCDLHCMLLWEVPVSAQQSDFHSQLHRALPDVYVCARLDANQAAVNVRRGLAGPCGFVVCLDVYTFSWLIAFFIALSLHQLLLFILLG